MGDIILGLLKIRVQRGINLAVRDSRTSDPYVVLRMASQKLKTRVIRSNCNPEWNDEVTLSISNFHTPIILEVYDEDTLSFDDKMGDAEIDIKPYVECLETVSEIRTGTLDEGSVFKRVHQSPENCLSGESLCLWSKGRLVQDMRLRLRNVETGEVAVQIEWVHVSQFPVRAGAVNTCLGPVEAAKDLLWR